MDLELEVSKGWFSLIQTAGRTYILSAKTKRELFQRLNDIQTPIEIVEILKGEIFDVEIEQKFYLSPRTSRPKPNVN